MSAITKIDTSIEEQKKQMRRTSSLRDLINRANQKKTVLALDASGSMSAVCQNGKVRADNLRDAIKDLPELPTITFGYGVRLFDSQTQADLNPNGGTPMTEAFRLAKSEGFTHVIVVTDGQPNDPSGALAEALDLKVDAIYVSDPPVPDFLVRLTGGKVGNISIDSLSFAKELTSAIRGLLADGGKI